MNQGACLCGTVRYEISPPYKWLAHCHCSICRKYHGTLHGTTVGVAKENFRWLQGEDAIAHYRSSEALERSFCSHCGSKLPDIVGEDAICPAGTLEGELGMKPGAHIFVGSKSPMYEIADQLPRFEEYPPGYGKAVPAPERSYASTNSNGVHGSCLCGDVVFEIDVAPQRLVNCHCSRCRRSRGTAHATNFIAKDEHLHWTQGADRVKNYAVPGARIFSNSFCERCGSLLPAPLKMLNAHLVPAGAIDTPLEIRAVANIYMDSRAPWFDVTDGLPQFEQMPPRERFQEFFG